MRKQLLGCVLVTVVAVFVLVLSGCDKSHKPLNGVYYGHYDHNSDTQKFDILAFDKNHPDVVGFRQNLDFIKINAVFPVKYTANTVSIKTEKDIIKLHISKDHYLLTCSTCDGKTTPKKYAIGMDKGKPFDGKVGSIAFNAIMEKAKNNGEYHPKW